MTKQWLCWINYGITGLVVFLLLWAGCLEWLSATDFSHVDIAPRKLGIPKSAFTRSAEEYSKIGPPALNLTFSPLSVQLPDLRRHLIYYGKNGRPDAKEDKPVLYFAFAGNKGPSSVSPGEKLFISYDKKLMPNQYIFSPNNQETPIWIEASANGNQSTVKVGMQGENGEVVRDPVAYADFNLPEKEFVRFSGTVWELGKWRVDGTLLARQKARWYGVDRFLERHGGEEYKGWLNKQRIDFGEGEEGYSVYVAQDDCLIWENNHWHLVKPGEASLHRPLMCVKKIDERVMTLELWDVDGKGKVVLNLIKTNEQWLPQNLEKGFKFIGARTRSQFIFEINQDRMLLRPHDWLLLVDGSWKKLANAKEIDDYVNRKTIGPLFVFDRIDRKDDKQVIIGTFFNSGRTEVAEVELALQQGVNQVSSNVNKKPPNEKKKKAQETNVTSVVKTGDTPALNIGPDTDGEDDEDEID